jgi:hypothetical protein
VAKQRVSFVFARPPVQEGKGRKKCVGSGVVVFKKNPGVFAFGSATTRPKALAEGSATRTPLFGKRHPWLLCTQYLLPKLNSTAVLLVSTRGIQKTKLQKKVGWSGSPLQKGPSGKIALATRTDGLVFFSRPGAKPLDTYQAVGFPRCQQSFFFEKVFLSCFLARGLGLSCFFLVFFTRVQTRAPRWANTRNHWLLKT